MGDGGCSLGLHHHSSDGLGASGSTNVVQGSKGDRAGGQAASPSSVTGSWAPGGGHRHMANQGQTQAILLPFPPTQRGFTPLASLLWNMQMRFEKKKTEKHVSLLARVSFPFPFSGWKARSSFKDIHLSFLCPWAPPFGCGPRTGNGPGTFQDCSTGWQVRETCPAWSRHLLAHLAAPGRSDQSGAEFQNQALPARGRGAVPAWNWRWVWLVPRTQEVCSPSSTPGELGCSTQMPRETAHGIQKLRQPQGERLKLQQHGAGF